MIKKNAYKRITVATLGLIVVAIVYFFPDEKFIASVNYSYVDAIEMPIYVLDNNNYVSRVNILKVTEDIEENIKYIINTLTQGTTESNFIANAFTPLIPENTVLIDYTLEDKILKLNFSAEFYNCETANERKIIESLIFSLCEFEEISDIMIFIEGEKLEKLPKTNETLPLLLNKNFGINILYDLDNVKNTISTINYYLSEYEDTTYYIPITKIENNEKEKIEIIIENLQTSPINQTNLMSYLKASATLDYYEILEESVVLSFNNELIADLSSEDVLEEVRYSIFLSLRDTYDINQVIFESTNEINVAVFN